MKLKTALLAIAALVSGACTQEYVTLGGYAQGGIYSVKYNPAGVKVSRTEAQQAVDGILEQIDTTLSGYNRKSLLSRRNAGEKVELNDMFREIEEISEHYRELSGGAFDVAAGPLFDVWGFGFTADSLPSDEAISAAMERCRKREVLNFNAIAQGYSCDKVAAYLYSIGVKDMLVDIGEIFCDGLNPAGKPWRVGVDRPVDGNNTPGADLDGIWESDGRAQGIVTSGNYRKFYIKDGKKYSHTIDPRSGYPVEHNLLSATIVAPSALEADAYATYCMVIGVEAAREFILSRPDLEGYLISDTEWASPGFNLVKQ
ncbi:MAG: FAD:protein FMN transferase [Bacteroidales bacterium]|nr:FAD:protein FMN transferase [Bacteroidales bacterium]